MLGTEIVQADDDDAGNADWAIPADRPNGAEIDPWMVVSDEVADEAENRYPYPAGLP